MNKKIEEVRTDYVDDINLRYIDVYFVGEEEGKTAVVVDLDTNKVIVIDNGLRFEPEVRDAITDVLADLKKPLPDKGLGYTIPKEMGWGKMIEIMKRHGAIPGDWRHFMQDCDTEINQHIVPEVLNCPSCGSNDLVSGNIDLEFLTCPVECNKCGHEWNDVYKYVGIQEVSKVTSF